MQGLKKIQYLKVEKRQKNYCSCASGTQFLCRIAFIVLTEQGENTSAENQFFIGSLKFLSRNNFQ